MRRPKPRVRPLGMQSGRIRNHQIAASSNWDRNHYAYLARLHFKARGRLQGGWSARHNNRNQWIQVTFRRRKVISAIATQGRQNANQWVTRYFITYSNGGLRFVKYRHGRRVKTFLGNKNRNSVVLHRLRPTIRAKKIRIHPVSWRGHISMRFELYGRNAVTHKRNPLGMQSRRIPDRAITASSQWDHNHRASNARLHFKRRGRRTGAWSSRHNKRGQWIQIDLGRRARLTGIATQGRHDANQWVTRYAVSYSSDGRRFRYYGHARRIYYLRGNKDRNTVKYNKFVRPFIARYVRVYPQSWHGHMSMRLELYGRRLGRPKPPIRPSGIASGRLPNRFITASSVWNKYHAAWLGRLRRKRRGRYIGGWASRHNNRRQWIQYDLKRPKRIFKVVTQGRQDANQWVTSYRIRYSQDGRRWVFYKKNSHAVVFRGNRDRNTVKGNLFRPTIIARFVRIYPFTWYRHIALRAEFYVRRVSPYNIPIGIEDSKIPNSAFRASSSWNRNHGPSRGRLNTRRQGRKTGAWSAKRNNRKQWIQVDLRKRSYITRILTQGRQDANQWVKTYTVSYSNNGRRFRFYRVRGRVRIFGGNSNRNTIVVRKLRPAIRARFIRIHPRTWYRHISLRFALRGRRAIKRPPIVGIRLRPLGMQSGRIRNHQITASSNWDRNHYAYLARLHFKARGRLQGGWSARRNNRHQWIQVKFRRMKLFKAVATQGRQNANQWVTRYYLSFSHDGVRFVPFRWRGRIRIFRANRNRNGVVFNRFAIRARAIRIHPIRWRGHISMRFELYGRTIVSNKKSPLGMQSRRIPDRAITASSQWDHNHRASNARLHFKRRGRRTGAWSSRHNKRGQWIQINVGRLARVTGIATQGRHDANQWVTRYIVAYSRNGRRFSYIKQGRRITQFRGNRNRNSVVYNRFARAVRAQYIRVYPQAWHGHMSLRLEVYGRRIGRPRPPIVPCGIGNGRLPNRFIKASSSWNKYHAAWFARLHRKRRGRYAGGWSARVNKRGQWIRFNLRRPKRIYKVVTQGRQDANQWVTRYKIAYSQNGRHWSYYVNRGRVVVFHGNRDRNTLRGNVFRPAIIAQYIRIYAVSWYRHISLRAEFYARRVSIYKIPLGIEDGSVRNRDIKSSSSWNRNHGPSRGRLNTRRQGRKTGAWSAKRNNRRQWIQVDLRRRTTVTQILTQGRQDANQWVKTYTVSYGNNGRRFIQYRYRGRVKVFRGNSDRNTIVVQNLRPYIRARFIRIHPRTWHRHISMRFGLRGRRITRPIKPPGPVKPKGRALGMRNGRIRNNQITASSNWDRYHIAYLARLHRRKRGRYRGGWSARYNNRNQFIQVAFKRPKKITAIATQGRHDANQWVTRYKVSYSFNGIHYVPYRARGRTVVFRGNRNRNTVKHNKLRPAIKAKFIRIHPISWYGHISMRLEFYGRNARRRYLPLGVEDGRIPDRAISASSQWNYQHRAANARLNFIRRRGRTGAWSSRHNRANQWLQIDIGSRARVTAVATQGRQDANQWVTSYYVFSSLDGRRFRPYRIRGRRPTVFRANRDRNSIVFKKLPRSITARYVRIRPRTWRGHISMRVELYGQRYARRPRPRPCGISNGRLPNRYITSSSNWNRYHAAHLARLNGKKRGRYVGAWCARRNNRRQWIQFQFRQFKRIYKVVTQGRQDTNQWVRSFTITYSQDGKRFVPYIVNGRPKVFPGNRDRNSLMENIFNPPFTAKFVRINPQSWYRHIALRAEFYAARASINKIPIGIQDGFIPNRNFKASSQWSRKYGPHRGRLYTRGRGRQGSCWIARRRDRRQWIQADVGSRTIITKILTQGRPDANQWVKTYTVSYSNNGKRFRGYRVRGRLRVFVANSDRNTVVVRVLRPVIRARFIRIHPRTWHGYISLRFGLRGRRPSRITPPKPPIRPTTRPGPVPLRHCPVTLDIAFLIDGSSNIGRRNFHLAKMFIQRLSSTFTITRHQTHIGLATYSNSANVVMRFRQYNNLARVTSAINSARLSNRAGGRLDIGLATAYQSFFRHEPTYIQRTLVVVTYGKPNSYTFGRIRHFTTVMERKGVKIFIIRIGRFRRGSLSRYSYKDRNVFYLRSFDELLRNSGRIAHAVCKQQHQEPDIYKLFFKRMGIPRPPPKETAKGSNE